MPARDDGRRHSNSNHPASAPPIATRVRLSRPSGGTRPGASRRGTSRRVPRRMRSMSHCHGSCSGSSTHGPWSLNAPKTRSAAGSGTPGSAGSRTPGSAGSGTPGQRRLPDTGQRRLGHGLRCGHGMGNARRPRPHPDPAGDALGPGRDGARPCAPPHWPGPIVDPPDGRSRPRQSCGVSSRRPTARRPVARRALGPSRPGLPEQPARGLPPRGPAVPTTKQRRSRYRA